MKLKTLTIMAMALGFMAVAAETSYAAEVKLKAASFLPSRTVFAKYFKDWVNHTNKQCAGMFKISVVGPAAIKTLEQWNALKNGVIDLHYGPPNYYKGVMVEGDVTILAKNESADQRKNGAWAMINDLHKKKMNAIYLTNILNGVNFYLYTSKPAVNNRFEGFRIRSVPIYDEFFKHLGGQPVRMSPGALYTALERKAVDGYGWPLWGIKDFGWHKHTKYRYGPGFFSANVNIIANQDKYNGMSSEARKCMMDQAIWLEGQWPSWRAAEAAKQTKPQDDAGIKYVDMGAGFSQKAEELYWAQLSKDAPAFIKKIRPLLSK
ncbi:MAG: hypothetical protein QGF71_05475 [Rhodospirillales bacterium]|nr:hypothetical protein [Rhodospirillales bacterium]